MATLERPAAPRQPYNMGYVWAISLVAALGGLMFGYDWVVISGTKPFFERFFNVSHRRQEGWAMASALVGCLLGAVLSGRLSDRFGRKRLLILAALMFVVSSLGTALADCSWSSTLWRIAGGVAIGLASNLSPMYIAEIAPAAVRGRLVAMNQFTIVRASCWPRCPTTASTISTRRPTGNRSPPTNYRPAGMSGGSLRSFRGNSSRARRGVHQQFAWLDGERAAPLDYEGVVEIVKEINKQRESRQSAPATGSPWEMAVHAVPRRSP